MLIKHWSSHSGNGRLHLISVIIVTFNSVAVLPECIASLERCSSATDIELIFVDNASTDGTWCWIKGYADAHSFLFRKVEMRNLEINKGFSYANNRGIEIASGDYILLLNPDTVVGQFAIQSCQACFLENRRIGAVGCRLELPNGKIDLACRRSLPSLWNSMTRFLYLSRLFPKVASLSSYNLTYKEEMDSYPVGCLCGAFLMISRSVCQQIGGLDESFFMYGEDVDWCKRISDAGHLIWYLGSETTIHRKGGNGGKKSASSINDFYHSMVIYFDKYYARKSLAMIRFSVYVAIWLLNKTHLVFNFFKS